LATGLVIAGAVISIVLGILAIYSYNRVKSGDLKNGGLIATILGVLMIATASWLPGVITLLGGILCYTSK